MNRNKSNSPIIWTIYADRRLLISCFVLFIGDADILLPVLFILGSW